MRALERAFGEQDAVIGDDAHRIAEDMGEAGHQRGNRRAGLNSVELRAVDDAGDDLRTSNGFFSILRDDAVDLVRIIEWRARRADLQAVALAAVEVANDGAGDAERMGVILAMWSATPEVRVCTSAPPVPRRDHLAGGGAHQRRPARKMVAWFFTMMDWSAMAGTYAARRARAHDHGNLCDALRRHAC